jgi:hypothetical protein
MLLSSSLGAAVGLLLVPYAVHMLPNKGKRAHASCLQQKPALPHAFNKIQHHFMLNFQQNTMQW